jgi:hypothetical protein
MRSNSKKIDERVECWRTQNVGVGRNQEYHSPAAFAEYLQNGALIICPLRMIAPFWTRYLSLIENQGRKGDCQRENHGTLPLPLRVPS